MTFKWLITGAAALALMACASNETGSASNADGANAGSETSVTNDNEAKTTKSLTLDAALDMQDDAAKARYDARNPKETLEFFGIEPGMTVVEVLPGGGWYSKILLPYLGDDGELIGADYSVNMWSKFGGFANEEFLEKRKTWAQTWASDALAWRGGTQAEVSAFALGSMPAEMKGTADAIIAVRAMHHLNRFGGGYWDPAIADFKAILKPGGVVGIVQHRGPEANPDTWANGDNGYLKQSFVIEKFENAGFELVGEPSEINGNPKDQPTADDIVWRLPPTLGTSREDPELKAKMTSIGESDRMTLLFRKK